MNVKLNKFLIIITSTILLISVIIFIYLLKNTYSSTDKYVIFKAVGDHVGEIIKSCKIGTDGKLDSACVDEAGKVCRRWSEFAGEYSSANSDGHDSEYDTCSNVRLRAQIRTDTIKTYTFSDNDEYFCVPCQSVAPDTWGCYACDDNPSVIKWAINSTPTDENCPGNKWHKETSITDDKECKYEAPQPACYECKSDNTIMEWRTSGDADNQCSAGYNKTEKTQAQCKYEAPTPTVPPSPQDKCYSCKLGEGKEYVYSDSKEAAASKTGGTECIVVSNTNCNNPPKSCYACDTKNGKEYIPTTSKANAEQAGGTNCTIVNMSKCEEVPDNPKTGTAGIIIAWLVGLSALTYSFIYFVKLKKISN